MRGRDISFCVNKTKIELYRNARIVSGNFAYWLCQSNSEKFDFGFSIWERRLQNE